MSLFEIALQVATLLIGFLGFLGVLDLLFESISQVIGDHGRNDRIGLSRLLNQMIGSSLDKGIVEKEEKDNDKEGNSNNTGKDLGGIFIVGGFELIGRVDVL